MLKMNYWTDKWDLHEDICPCDVHFNDWVADQKLKNKLIYHFGTGTHHVVGSEQARERLRQQRVRDHRLDRGIRGLHQAGRPSNSKVARTTSPISATSISPIRKLLPDFDVVTMVHLCEFFFPNTASDEYGGLTTAAARPVHRQDRGPAAISCSTRTRSASIRPKADDRGVGEGRPVERVGEFKTLLVYRKKA